jgi:LacI family transcriptional regulator
MDTFSGRERYMAYKDTMQKHKLPIQDKFVLEGNFLKETAYISVEKLIAGGELPTALFCANDAMAIAAIEALNASGLQVPADLSIVGFDDATLSSHINPKLTTVRLPIAEMAKAAVDKVISLCQDESTSFSTMSFPTKFIIRESCSQLHDC